MKEGSYGTPQRFQEQHKSSTVPLQISQTFPCLKYCVMCSFGATGYLVLTLVVSEALPVRHNTTATVAEHLAQTLDRALNPWTGILLYFSLTPISYSVPYCTCFLATWPTLLGGLEIELRSLHEGLLQNLIFMSGRLPTTYFLFLCILTRVFSGLHWFLYSLGWGKICSEFPFQS
ncbi:hypothetical protein K439DRAFT_252795 [Ramaria rubella]|nr:hypothetical protein K439DRAFT_336336 [Ramaria rubella]KAF8581106.1 hypothetical protein K439DRAFT_252795 [Ramaria rubella]